MQAVTTWRPRFVQELQGLRTTMWDGSFEENLCKWPPKGLSDEMRLVKYLGSRLVSSSSSGRAEERTERQETDFDARLACSPISPNFRKARGQAGSKYELMGKSDRLTRRFPFPATFHIPQVVSILPLSRTSEVLISLSPPEPQTLPSIKESHTMSKPIVFKLGNRKTLQKGTQI